LLFFRVFASLTFGSLREPDSTSLENAMNLAGAAQDATMA
jgi:hypothetical protein